MLRTILFTFGVRMAGAVLNFLVIIILSQQLGAEGKGICTKYITVIANALIFCDFLGGPPLVYLVARYRISNILLPCYLWSAFTSAAVMYVFYLLHQADSSELFYLSILSFLNSCVAIHQNILSGRMKFARLNTVMFLQAALTFVSLKMFMSLAGPLTITYIWALALAWGFAALLGFFFVLTLEHTGERISPGKFISSAFRYGFINISGHGLQFINQRLSYYLLSERLLGIFSNAVSLGESVWMITNSIVTVQYGKVSNTSSRQQAERISLVLFKLNFLLCLCAALVLVFLPDRFFVWIFGGEFSGMHAVLLYLFPGLVFYSGYLILGHHFSGTGRFGKNLACIAAGLVLTGAGLLAVYLGSSAFTMMHAAVITCLSYFGNFACALFIFGKDAAFRPSDFFPSPADLAFIRRELKKNPGNQQE